MNLYTLIVKLIIVRYKRWDRRTALTKRQQFVGITLLLTVGLLLTQIVSVDLRYEMVAVLTVTSYVFAAFALRDDLGGVEWVTLLILPALFTGAISTFYFLLPVRWLTRIPFAILYAVGFYALLLTENIYNVAAIRTIALLRAAHTVGFLLTLVTFFFLTQTVLTLHAYAYIIVLSNGILSILLSMQLFWATILEQGISKQIWILSIITGMIMMQLSWIFSFWPVNTTIFALFLTTCFYSIVGMGQQFLQEKLYKKTVQEFLTVTIIVFIILFLTTQWRGNY